MQTDRLPVRLDGVGYLVDLTEYQRRPVEAFRNPVDQGAEPGEQSLANPFLWHRTAQDWVIGAGQTWYDLPEESDRRRFRESKYVDVWDTRSVKLLPLAQRKVAVSDTIGWRDEMLMTNGQNVYLARASFDVTATTGWTHEVLRVGTTYPYGDDVAASTWSATTVAKAGSADPPAASWLDWTSNGDSIFFTDGITVYELSGPAATTYYEWSEFGVELLQSAMDRLIGAKEHIVYEFNGSGDPRVVHTHPNDSWRWDAFAPAPNGIYYAGHAGDKAAIYLMTLVEDTSLGEGFVVASMPDGEAVNDIAFYGGLLIIGTTRGIRLARITGGGFLSLGPVIEIPAAGYHRTATCDAVTDEQVTFDVYGVPDGTLVVGSHIQINDEVMILTGITPGATTATVTVDRGVWNTTPAAHANGDQVTSHPVKKPGVAWLEPQAEFVWFGWPNYDEESTGLGRISLARFSDEMTPAYASDLMSSVTTHGELHGDVHNVITFEGRRYWTVAGGGVWGENAEGIYSPDPGIITSGRITYGIGEDKQFTSLELRSEPLPASAGAAIIGKWIADNQARSVRTATTIEIPSSQRAKGDINSEHEWIEVQVELRRGSVTTVTPELSRWSLRGLPLPYRAEEIYLPILNHRVVEAPAGGQVKQEPWKIMERLLALYDSRSPVVLEMGNETRQVYVDGIIIEGRRIKGWTDTHDWVEGTIVLKLVTLEGT